MIQLPFLGKYSKDSKPHHKDTYTRMFIVSLYITDKNYY